ncbi:MAG: alpha-glucosidase C-terminal domain-containing protein [Muribaculaceae bacterium]|nr:alpha-glucosidase C-terminal domain-containing protein [Muribaculaceae bacterium]
MKASNILFSAALASALLTGCTSYEIDMPANPEPPAVGREVSTDVIYQANPAFFGTQDCLKGLNAQLERIAGMDCDILWVMPIYVRGEKDAIGSPYCIKDFKGVNPKYGTEADVKALVDNAHSKGMKVMFDWIANHTAWDHPWVTQYPDRYAHDADGNISSANGWSDVAQLDFSNQATREAMIDAMQYWVRDFGIDGYRCDYADGVPGDFWSSAIAALRAINPSLIMLAETSDTDYYSYGFNMIYDWNSAPTISAAFNGAAPSEIVKEAKEALAKVPAGNDDSILRYAFNHDVAAENNVSNYFGSIDAIPAAYVCASMLNGTPMIYSGMDATGISGKLSFFNYTTLDFSAALSDTYKAINKAFEASAEVRRGVLTDYSTSAAVCFTRSIPGKTLLVVVNVSGKAQSVRTPISLAQSTMTDLLSGKNVSVGYSIELDPYDYTILMN